MMTSVSPRTFDLAAFVLNAMLGVGSALIVSAVLLAVSYVRQGMDLPPINIAWYAASIVVGLLVSLVCVWTGAMDSQRQE